MSPAKVHRLQVRVFYGDTDQMGVAYYANYLRWFEMARNEYLRSEGYSYARLEEQGILLPVTQAECRYHKPARYDDLLEIDAWVASHSRVRVDFAYHVLSPGGDSLLAQGSTRHACLDRDGRPRRLPAALLDIVAA